jgi:hypothetical protein
VPPLVPQLRLPGLKNTSGQKLVKQHVRAGLTVYPHSKDPVFPNRATDIIRFDWTDKTDASLRKLSWQKSMGRPAGRWSATVKEKPRGSLSIGGGDILPDDWVDINILRNGLAIPLCRGIIDTVTENTTGMGATVRTWEITGRDHGALWDFPIAYQNIYVRTLNELVAGLFTKRVKGKIGGNPSELFKILIEGAFTKGNTSSSWVLPDKMAKAYGVSPAPPPLEAFPQAGSLAELPLAAFADIGPNGSFLDILDIDTSGTTRGAYYNEVQLWTNPGEGLGQTISNWCNPLLNEFIYDLAIDKNYPNTGKAKAKVSALIRERPFPIAEDTLEQPISAPPQAETVAGIPTLPDVTEAMNNSAWFKLTTWDLPNWIVQNATLGRSNTERFNLFELLADVGFGGSEGEQCAQAPPAIYRNSIEKHGLRPMLEHTRFVADGSKGKGMGAWITERKNWQRILVNWHCLNPWFMSGTIPIPLALPEIRIGQKLRILNGKKEETWSYYLEGTALDWMAGAGPQNPPTAKTQLMVSRGWQGTDASLAKAFLSASKQYETKFK